MLLSWSLHYLKLFHVSRSWLSSRPVKGGGAARATRVSSRADRKSLSLNINSGPVFSSSPDPHCRLCACPLSPTRMGRTCAKHTHIYSHTHSHRVKASETSESVNVFKLDQAAGCQCSVLKLCRRGWRNKLIVLSRWFSTQTQWEATHSPPSLLL